MPSFRTTVLVTSAACAVLALAVRWSEPARQPPALGCVVCVCGDGEVTDAEECDDGDSADDAACDGDCTSPLCGDGHLNTAAGEQCDDGNLNAGDGCGPGCESEGSDLCGDGRIELDEECDDGDTVDDPVCDGDCTYPLCGDGRFNIPTGEQCDDGNTSNGDGCSERCRLECGNDALDGAETCDDGDTVDDALCDGDCTAPLCGDGRLNTAADEQCDDGDTLDGPACDGDCSYAQCGDGHFNAAAGEGCDDGNHDDGDGCTGHCLLECGDGILEGVEGCDDGNRTDGDGCSAVCQAEACGDGTCDTIGGETVLNCPSDCTAGPEPACGDGIVQNEEACDAGPRNDDTPGSVCRTDCTTWPTKTRAGGLSSAVVLQQIADLIQGRMPLPAVGDALAVFHTQSSTSPYAAASSSPWLFTFPPSLSRVACCDIASGEYREVPAAECEGEGQLMYFRPPPAGVCPLLRYCCDADPADRCYRLIDVRKFQACGPDEVSLTGRPTLAECDRPC